MTFSDPDYLSVRDASTIASLTLQARYYATQYKQTGEKQAHTLAWKTAIEAAYVNNNAAIAAIAQAEIEDFEEPIIYLDTVKNEPEHTYDSVDINLTVIVGSSLHTSLLRLLQGEQEELAKTLGKDGKEGSTTA